MLHSVAMVTAILLYTDYPPLKPKPDKFPQKEKDKPPTSRCALSGGARAQGTVRSLEMSLGGDMETLLAHFHVLLAQFEGLREEGTRVQQLYVSYLG